MTDSESVDKTPVAPVSEERRLAVETKGLTKKYDGKTALSSLDLSISAGDIFGYIGPNGAGKTTTIRILAGLLRPSRGSAKVEGIDVIKKPQQVKKIVGYMPDSFGVYDNMSLGEYLEFFAAAYYIPRSERGKIIDGVLELTDLGPKRDDLVSAFSKGMKQRACLAKTLLHDPQVLILDEPAAGLDPRARIEFRELLRELQNMGKTILVSSHILTELSSICDSVGIIEAGKLIAAGEVARILRNLRTSRRYRATFLTDEDAERAQATLDGRSSVSEIERSGRQLTIGLDMSEEQIATLVEELVARKVRFLSFDEEEADLETAFMALTKGDLR